MAQKLRVMIVDDDPDLLFLLTTALEERYEVVTALNGIEALALVADAEPDLLLVDVMMPLMSGFEFVRRVRYDPLYQSTPVILLSARDSRADIKRGYEEGVDLYLTKPVEIDRLIRNIEVFRERGGVAPAPKKFSVSELRSRADKRIARAGRPGAVTSVSITPPPVAPPPPVVSPPPVAPAPRASSTPLPTSVQTPAIVVPQSVVPQPAPPKQKRTVAPAAAAPTDRGLDEGLEEEEKDEEVARLDPFARAEERLDGKVGTIHQRPAQPGAADSEEAKSPARTAPPIPPRRKTKRVLIADDDGEILEMAREMLDEFYQLVEARDGLEAVHKADRYKPDLFVIDGMMPRMSGYQMCQFLRQSPEFRDTPIVFMSAKSSPKDRRYVQSLKVSRFLAKPFTPEELFDAVETITSQRGFHVRADRLAWEDVLEQELGELHRRRQRRETGEQAPTEGLGVTRQRMGEFLAGAGGAASDTEI